MILLKINNAVADRIGAVIDRAYRPPISKLLPREMLRYMVCGAANYIILDAILYYLIYHYVVGVDNFIDLFVVTISPHIASLTIVFPITFLIGFWLNRYVAFKATEMGSAKQISRYALSILGSMVISYLSLKILVEAFEIWATPAKMLSSIITAIYGASMARFYTFKKSGRAGGETCKQK